DSRVPARVQEEDVVRLDEGEAGAARLQAEEERGLGTGAEVIDHPLAGRGGTVQESGGDAPVPEDLAECAEVARELAEHERTVPCAGEVLEPVHELAHLRRG